MRRRNTLRCHKCGTFKPSSHFLVVRTGNASPHCADCRKVLAALKAPCPPTDEGRAYDRAWYARNKEARAAAKKTYRATHPWEMWAAGVIRTKVADGEDVQIGADELLALVKRQRRLCALTAMPFWVADKRPGCPAWDSPSVDRIDHDGPYALGNIRVVLHCVNTFRGRMTDECMNQVIDALVSARAKRNLGLQSRRKLLKPQETIYVNPAP